MVKLEIEISDDVISKILEIAENCSFKILSKADYVKRFITKVLDSESNKLLIGHRDQMNLFEMHIEDIISNPEDKFFENLQNDKVIEY